MVKTYIKSVIAFLCCLICCLKALSQDSYVISHLDNTNGLSNNSVMGVFQDSDKLLWLNTWDGLDVYNGTSFDLFKSNDVQSSFSLPNNVVIKVGEDKFHQIWISTEKGITQYDKTNGELNHYLYNQGKVTSVGSADYMLTISNNSDVVCGLRLDSVLFYYNRQQRAMLPLRFKKPIGKIAKIEFDDDGRLWTLSMGSILRVFEKKNGFYEETRQLTSPQGINIFTFVNHKLFITTGNLELCEVTSDFQLRKRLDMQHFVNGIQYFQGHYFIAWLYKGMQEYDADFKPVSQLVNYCPVLNNTQVNSFTVTDSRTLWVSTDDYGIFKVQKQASDFGLADKVPGSVVYRSNVQTITKVDNELWLGTKNNGILQINNAGNKSAALKQTDPVASIFDEGQNSYFTFKKGADGVIYIGSEANGVTVYDPLTRKFTPWMAVKGTSFDGDFFRVHCILPEKDSSVYVGYNTGLLHIKLKREGNSKFVLDYLKPCRVSGHFLKPGNNMIYAMLDLDNRILIGYRFAGLCLLNKNTGQSVNITAQAYPGSLSNNSIVSIFKDRTQRIWIGTNNGLNLINQKDIFKKQPVFQTFTTESGLPNNNIHAIEQDSQGYIWASTNRGLVRIDEHTFKMIRYNVEDGLQNNEFSDNAVLKDNTGRLFFGGISGFNHFDPVRIAPNKSLSNLMITNLNIAGKNAEGISLLVIKPVGDHLAKTYRLQRNENSFSLKVQPTDGYANMKFRYQYYLKNYDNKWHETTENTNIDYRNLPPGEYSFYIKWSNGQGEWTLERKVFDIEILQYFWLTGIAKAFYGLVILVGVYAFFRIRKSRLEIKHRLALENLIRVKEQKLYQEKMDFFTNITHELQTPLTLILGSIERFLSKNKNGESKHAGWNFLNIANHEAFRLQYLTHRLLEFRKAEAGHLKVQLSVFNLSNLLVSIADLFEPIAEQNAVQANVCVIENIQVTSDKDKIEMIVFNLLSNAFKYTRQGEQISFVVAETEGHNVSIVVSNSGYNGPAEDLHLLFEQFYTLDNNDRSKISSGIGLAFARQLTELLGGAIGVAAKDRCITFKVVLPLNVPVSATSKFINTKPSEMPSELLKSAIGSQQLMENKVTVNNDLALVEDLSNSSKRAILIVEDEPAIRLLLREILTDRYIVYEAENGRAALELLKRIIPNLILSDVLMDDLGGLKLCSEIKNNFETCHIPFVLLSALSSAEERLEGFEVGADAYIAKPFNATALLNKIDQLIHYREKIQSFFKKDEYVQPAVESGLKSDDKLFLEKVIKMINEQISSPDLDSPYLEKAMAMSKMSLYRKVKAFTGMTPAELIKHVRLKTAASLLKSTTLTVSEIYYQTGFNNQSYFYREFKRAYSFSPKEFREQHHPPIMVK